MNFQEGFTPFGKSPAVGDILYLGSSGGFSAGLAFGALDGSETGPIVQLALSTGSLTNATLGLGGIPGASASGSFAFISRPAMRINIAVKANEPLADAPGIDRKSTRLNSS